jgi:subtilisin family serine protease
MVIAVGCVVTAGWADAAQPVPTDSRGRPLYEQGSVAVKLRPGVAPLTKALPARFGIPDLDDAALRLGASRVEPMFPRATATKSSHSGLFRIYRVVLPRDVDVRRAAAELGRSEFVEYAEPIVRQYAHEVPDDPDYALQSFWRQIEAEEAWDVHKGEDGAEVVIGISDSGVAWRHEDLVDNIWRNLGEDADGDGEVIEMDGGNWVFDPDDVNGVDDDGNGYVDDFVGWNFLNDDGGEDNDPVDPSGHGTHVAGLAAARTDNGVGVASISWNVKLMATSAANQDSEDLIERPLSGVIYLAQNGADIINMSWGGETYSQVYQDVMEYAHGLGSLLVSSAGNESSDELAYPSSLPGVVSVAAVGSTDRLASYSNHGLGVDIAAPGGDGLRGLRSTVPTGYSTKQGTSMASPIAAGVFALVKSQHPGWSNDRLVEQVLGTALAIDDINPEYVGEIGYGRVDAANAVSGTPTTATPELQLMVEDVRVDDATGDGSIEAGESAQLRVSLRNFNHLAGSQNLVLELHSANAAIQIVDGAVSASIGPDQSLEIEDAFVVVAGENAPSGLYELSITASASDVTISPISDLMLPKLVVANGGVLVWEGADGETFSGRYLADELVARGYEVLYLAGEFPSGLGGFDAVFLSFGNAGIDNPDLELDYLSARLDADWKVAAIESYLKSGGRLYLEGSDTLGYDIYDLVDGSALLPLFGIESGVDGGTKEIESLDGQSGALTEGMQFLGTSQDPVEWIDIFTPGEGTAAFVESDYGVVAVQYAGSYGQRTFNFAYTIADLEDGPTSRTELLDAIVDFLKIGEAARQPALRRGPERRLSPAS